MGTGLRQRQQRPPKQDHRTIELRQFKGVNLTDSRVAIGDEEFSWLENAMTIGNGAIQILNGPGASIAAFAQGVARLYGRTLNGSPIFIVVGADGSLSQLTVGGVTTVIAPAGTVGGNPVIAVWRGTTILILDATRGYMSWDGALFTVIDATRVGTALAVFQGRAVIVNGRTIALTSPNTFNDFNPANGATSTILTDEAFAGNINEAVSALEQLWLVGDGAVEALANIVTTTGPTVTTFSITNIVTNLGSNAQHSVIGYFRALAFLAPFGAYALSGVTPQKISEKLDGLFPNLTIDGTVSAAVAVVQNLLCLIFNVTYTGQQAQAGPGPRPLQLVFTGGKWCFAAQGPVTWITDILVHGVAQAWATDGTHVFQLFGAPESQAVTYKIQWKLSPFGRSTQMKQVLKTGLEFQASATVAPRMLIENETSDQETAGLQTTVDITWVNNLGQPVQFVNTSGQLVTWAAEGMVLSRQVSEMWGRYVGWSLVGTDAPYLVQCVQLQLKDGLDWATPGTAS
jgi:hypothetical protein